MAAATTAARRPAEVRYVERDLELFSTLTAMDNAVDVVVDRIRKAEQYELNVRKQQAIIEDREDELFMDVANEFGHQSIAAQERELKSRKMVDEKLVAAKRDLAEYQDALREMRAEQKIAERQHNALVTRLSAYTAYLDFLAAYKTGRNIVNASDIPGAFALQR